MTKIKLTTSLGDIALLLDETAAPETTKNFLAYVENGFYNGTIFHRVIDNFMIQGGGFDKEMRQKDTERTIENEANNGLSNRRGTIAMARTPDPHSASSQFFINVKDNNFLDHTAEDDNGWGYCVFGEVIDGMNTVDEITKSATHTVLGHQDVPVSPIEITQAETTD
jgi:peptidyl-prolyl cis-trans isomerase B (cyclophilin B)